MSFSLLEVFIGKRPGLICPFYVPQGGIYIFSLLENYAAGLSLLTTVFFEAVAVSWVYGLKNFSDDVFLMLGHKPGLYWRICWKFVSPCFLAVRYLTFSH